MKTNSKISKDKKSGKESEIKRRNPKSKADDKNPEKKDENRIVKEKRGSGSILKIIFRPISIIIFKILVILVLISAIVLGGRFGWKKFTEIKTEKSHALIFKELERCAELVTAKTTYTDIISIKKTRIAGLAKSFSIIKYTGVIRAGIHDIREAKISVSDGGKKATVTLPPMEILSNDISSIEVFDESKSVFVEISIKEVMEEIRFNQETSSAKIMESGFLDESKKQAERILESVLSAAGLKEVEVR